jgi:phosphoenolpyruvate carboxylase
MVKLKISKHFTKKKSKTKTQNQKKDEQIWNQNKIREIKISIKGEVKNKFKVYKRNQDKNHTKKD